MLNRYLNIKKILLKYIINMYIVVHTPNLLIDPKSNEFSRVSRFLFQAQTHLYTSMPFSSLMRNV